MCRTPTNYCFDKPLPPVPYGYAFNVETELVPEQLFRRPTVLPPKRAAYAVVEPQSPVYVTSISSSTMSRTPSLRTSRRSISSSISSMSNPLSSAPTSPYSHRRSLELTCTSPSLVRYTPVSSPEPQPEQRRSLRRRVSPTHDTLRNLRAKESDACLQKVCEEQVSAYLNGTLLPRETTRRGSETVEEDCRCYEYTYVPVYSCSDIIC